MRISPTATFVPAAAAIATASTFRAPTLGEVALVDLPGVGFYSLRDTLTGYGRATGYDSLANASRAAYALSVGAESPAAGVFRQGERFFVRGLAGVTGTKPHAFAPGLESPQMLHFEGNAAGHFAWVRDSRLVVMVDGATKIFAKDAHHQPPAA